MEFIYGLINRDEVVYVKATFLNKKDALKVKKAINGEWIGDKQLKLRVNDDKVTESFDNRTVVIQDIPSNFNKDDLLDFFDMGG